MPRALRFCSASQSSTTTPALTISYAARPVYVDNDGAATTTVMDARSQGIGMSTAQTFTASVTQTVAGTMTGITLKAQVSYTGTDPTVAASAHWTDIEITDLADGATQVEHSITGSDGATVRATYGTTNATNAPYCRVLVKSIGANAAADESASVFVVAQ